jgi:uncharacterized membrane protein YfcA
MLEILLLVGLVVFITHTLEAVTGFGCTVLAFPFMILLMSDLEQVKIYLSVLAWLLAVYFVVTQFKHICWKQFRIIFLLAGLGMPIGMLLFDSLDGGLLKKMLGAFIVISAAVQLFNGYFSKTLTRTMPKVVGYLFLLTGGIVHGVFAIGGPLIVLYSTKKIPDKGQFRATMCLLWATLNTILIIQYLLDKKLTPEVGHDLLFLFPFLVGGVFAGELIHKRVSEVLFKKIVFTSLLLIGAIMVF